MFKSTWRDLVKASAMNCCNHKEFNGKVVLVTGSSSGIGEGTAMEFARLGAQLSITGINAADKLEEVARECQKVSPDKLKPLITVADVSIEEEAEKLLKKTLAAFGKLDVLVNNAGLIKPGTLGMMSMESYDQVLNVNMRALYHLTMLAAPHLEKTKGNVVNVSSVAGIRIVALSLPYSISKSGVDQFTKGAALELAPKGVRVNAVNPGLVVTDIFCGLDIPEENRESKINEMGSNAPMGRPGTVQEIANAIVFLASDKASYITGACLVVDGGHTLPLNI